MHGTKPPRNHGVAALTMPKTRARRRGVLLVNVGTPDAPDLAAVRRYLVEFLSDPHVIQLPRWLRWMQRPVARLIAWRRGRPSTEKYQKIWTHRGSPLRTIMEDQAAELGKRLPVNWDVFLGMRYGRPGIEEALQEIARREIEHLVVVPMYPQFSKTTTGTTIDEVYRVLKQHALHVNVSARISWNNDAGYLNAQAQLIAEYARKHGLAPRDTYLLLTAHGLPVSYIHRGDPYERQLTESVRLIVERLGWPADRLGLAYQSRMGPTEWLKPELTATLRELAASGERRVLIVPISFAADCLETLEELDIQARQLFASMGGELQVCPALNTHPHFIEALRELVVRGSRPVVAWNRGHEPLLTGRAQRAPIDLSLDRLVMIGVSLENRIGSGRGPRLHYTDPDGLACAKKSRQQVEAVLTELKAETSVCEAFVWNTCFRFEMYAWLDAPPGDSARRCAVRALRDRIFSPDLEGVNVNTLFGRSAWHHLMRTIAGLNSGLPGDTDVIGQFCAVLQPAERAGTAGPLTRRLVEDTVRMVARMREETSWGRLDPGYCYAALSQVQVQVPRQFANLRHVVVGGSTTSRSVLQSLYERFNVKEPAVTLIYRAHHGGQMKLLRKAVGHGRRLRVHAYSDPAVRAAILDADVVHCCIDRSEAVLNADMLNTDQRDFSVRPLYVIDFNSAGSTRDVGGRPGLHLWTAAQLDAEVERYADSLCAGKAFPQAVDEAEAWIEEQAPAPAPLGLELPCATRDPNGHPTCGRCGRQLTEEEAKNTA